MSRTTIRKTNRGVKDISIYEQAYEDIKKETFESVRATARKFQLCHVTLGRYMKKRDEETLREGEKSSVKVGRTIWNSKVFSEDWEKIMGNYIIRAAEIYYGFSPKEIRRFAYELAVKYKLIFPSQWKKNKMASRNWFTKFIKRQPQLSIKCAQPTNMSRANSFNETNVNIFFDNLQNVIDKYKFEAKDIYNADEIGITTVQKSDEIVTERGTGQADALTSAERGNLLLVTIMCAVNAIGNFIPPVFIFPRLRHQEDFVRDRPTGSIAVENANGWMQEKEFLIFLKHFQKYTTATVSHKVLLLLDNHPSYMSIQALDYCSENGIIVLSFPPYCSHKLQPLNRLVHEPLKKAINSSYDSWLRNNPGKTMTMYSIPSIMNTALPMAMTLTNIQAGFRCTGIFPYNRNIFTALDYAPSNVTDRPAPLSEITDKNENSSTELREANNEPIPSTSLSFVPYELNTRI